MFKKHLIKTTLLITTSLTTLNSFSANATNRILASAAFHTAYLTDAINWNNGVPQMHDNAVFNNNNQYLKVSQNVEINDIYTNGQNGARIYISPNKTFIFNNIIGNHDTQIIIDRNPANGDAGELIILGNQVQNIDFFDFRSGGSALEFRNNLTVDAELKSRGASQGILTINGNVVFNNKIGQFNNNGIGFVVVKDKQQVTFKHNTRSYDMELGKNSTVNLDPANRDLVINSNIATNGNGTQVDNRGKLNIKGSNLHTLTVFGDIGSDDTRIANINIENGTKTVTLNSEVYAKKITVGNRPVTFRQEVNLFTRRADNSILDRGELEFAADGTIVLEDTFHGDISSQAPNTGTININKNIHFAGNVSNDLKSFHVNGDYTLVSDGAIFDKEITAKNNNTAKLHINGDTSLLRGVGTPGKQFNEIQFLGDHTLILAEHNVNVGKIITKNPDQGTILLKGNNRILNNPLNLLIGQALSKVKSIGLADANATLTVADANINANNLELSRANQNIIINNNINFAGHVKGTGKIEFLGNSQVNWLGDKHAKLAEVKTNGGNVSFNQNTYTNVLDLQNNTNAIINHRMIGIDNIRLGDATLRFAQKVDRAAAINIQTPHKGQITFTSGGLVGSIGAAATPAESLVFIGVDNYTLNGDIYTDNITFGNGAYNTINPIIRIVVPQANVINMPATWQYVHNYLSMIPALAPIGPKASLLTATTPHNAANKAIIDKISAPLMQSNSNLEQTITELNAAGINFTKKEIEIAFEDTLINTKPKEHQALLYAGSMAQLSQTERTEATKQIAQSTQSQSQVTEQVTAALNSVIDHRLDELSFDNVITPSGVSAGDAFKPKLQGAWIRGTYGTSKNNGTFSYKGNIAGVTIGSDFELSEQTIVGIAYSNMSAAFKHKKNHAGDKTNSNSHILSLYGAYQLNDNISVKTMLSAGMSNITTKRSILNNIASSKIKNKNYNAKTSVSYNFKAAENIYLVPNLGLAYSHSSDGAYSEKGAGVHNISTKAKTNNNLTAIAGLNAIMPHKISNTLSISPSIHASVESHLWNKKSKVKAKLAWMDDYFANSLKDNKTERFSYNIGGGIVTQRDNIEVAMNYNCNIRQKYQNHQGSIKLKLAF